MPIIPNFSASSNLDADTPPPTYLVWAVGLNALLDEPHFDKDSMGFSPTFSFAQRPLTNPISPAHHRFFCLIALRYIPNMSPLTPFSTTIPTSPSPPQRANLTSASTLGRNLPPHDAQHFH